ncbi:MAG: hypothetical protein WCJ61_17650 [Paludibacter sp.]
MTLLNNKQLPKMITVFLLISGLTYFVVQFFRQGKIEDLLRNELKQITANEAMTWKGGELSDERLALHLNNNLPSFKNIKQPYFDGISNSDVDFPDNSNLEKNASTKSNVSAVKSDLGNYSNVTNYSFAQKKSTVTYASDSKDVSSTINTFQNNNTAQLINTRIQAVGNFASNSPSFSKTSFNTFLANNKLSITTDLSENHSTMLVGGDSNPGDPGVPVGDGTWVLIILLAGYGLVLKKWN